MEKTVSIALFLFVVCVESCTRSVKVQNAERVEVKMDSIAKRTMAIDSAWYDIPLDSFKRYQTFNEYQMVGEGHPIKEPFVYVKSDSQNILVRASNLLDSLVVYMKGPYGWENTVYKDFEFFYEGHCLCEHSNPKWAQKIDRLLLKDSIVELRCNFDCGELDFYDFLIKVPNHIESINLYRQDVFGYDSPFACMRNLLNFYNQHHSLDSLNTRYHSTKAYKVIKSDGYIRYHRIDGDHDDIVVKINSLDEFGVFPEL